ncbi:MAG: hypothetical protein HZC25_15270 [Rhodospirillales bacterium]|nr:hypothetical protein [Rhodospirillales bacterium]
MTRGIITIVWGDKGKLPLDRLLRSTARHHPELSHRIIEIDGAAPGPHALLEKARMFDRSPFEETLYLDADTVVLGRLDFGFEKAARYGVALSICENPWARRYHKIFRGDEIEYNTGVIFFTRAAEPLFDAWKDGAQSLDASILYTQGGEVKIMPANDQGSFAAALERTGVNPFVLPCNWNFRPQWQKSFFGPLKIWHHYADPPAYIEAVTEFYAQPNHVVQYHDATAHLADLPPPPR